MKIIADLHIHSRFSRACSKQINIENLEKYAKIKGLNLLGTGDFTHKLWRNELDNYLKEDEYGILRTKSNFPFLWQTEISLMYTQDGSGRKVHFVILAPSKEVVDQITEELGKKGRLDYDGRPIFGFSSIELIDILIGISNDIEIIPAHAWTSWFGILGSKSGFDSIEKCFKEKSKYIHAIETGMSSDPAMNWRISSLDKYNLVSFSDMHSFWLHRIGREATIFDCELKYNDIINAIRTRKGLKETIEVFPEYGKYHWDGHKNCGISFSPKETRKHNGVCPVCKKPLTIGVEYRIEELADRPEGYVPKNPIPFKRIIPLAELIAALYSSQPFAKKVFSETFKLIKEFGSELNVLLEAQENQLKKLTNEKIADIIIKNRAGKIKVKPGYDGVYGEIILNKIENKKQRTLDNF